MSRIGKLPINIPAGVIVTYQDNVVSVKGPKGELSQAIDPSINVSIVDNVISFSINEESDVEQKQKQAFYGLYRALVNNMVIGVSEGYKKEMELVGVGYRVQNTGNLIEFNLGYTHAIFIQLPKEIKAEPYVGKMAACGASYGGYSVYYLCGTHGNTFDAFIAHAGIFNEEHMYMTTEEMWFPNFDNGGLHETVIDPRVGTPEAPIGPAGDGVTFGGIKQGGSPWSNDPKAIRHYALSPHKLVTKWHTPLMVIHGGMDYRVPVDEGMAAYNAAQMMGVPSRLLIFPDENHWILKPQNAMLWHREYFRWLEEWL